MTNPHLDKRNSERFRYRCDATLCATDKHWTGHLLNISETGALVAVLENNTLNVGDRIELTVEQDEREDITLMGSVAHTKTHYVGLRCDPVSSEDREQLFATLKALSIEIEV